MARLPFADFVRTGSAAGDRCRQVGFARGWSGAAARLSRGRGHLKLAYSQFEELESFAKFGTRLDDATRKNDRSWGAHPRVPETAESKPWSMVEQICVLLAWTAGLFDRYARKGKDAERRAPEGRGADPADITGRFASADNLSDADRKAVLDSCHADAGAVPAAEGCASKMSGTIQSLERRIDGAADLEGVVRAMKALAASSIGQYERAVASLNDYYRTVELGLSVCLRQAGAAKDAGSGGPSAQWSSGPTRDWWAVSTRWWLTWPLRLLRAILEISGSSGQSASA